MTSLPRLRCQVCTWVDYLYWMIPAHLYHLVARHCRPLLTRSVTIPQTLRTSLIPTSRTISPATKLYLSTRTSNFPFFTRVCLSVCLSVCLPQVDVLQKRLNVGSRKQRHTIAHMDSSFLLSKSRQNSNGLTPSGGAKCRWGRFVIKCRRRSWKLATFDAKRCHLSSVASLSHWASTSWAEFIRG